MLMIVMHKRLDYLNSLIPLLWREGISEMAVIDREDIGSSLIGKSAKFVFHSGSILSDYDKALIAVVKGEQKAKHLLNLIRNDTDLALANMEDRGFMCTLPLQRIEDLRLRVEKGEIPPQNIRVCDYLLVLENRIIHELQARQKNEAIKEIAASLRDAEEIIDFDGFLRDVFIREATRSTGISDNIALPHARSDAVKKLVIALDRSKDGLDFISLDDKPVKLIFLIGTPREKGLDLHLKILAQVSRLLKEASFRDAIVGASSPREILSQFRKVEEQGL